MGGPWIAYLILPLVFFKIDLVSILGLFALKLLLGNFTKRETEKVVVQFIGIGCMYTSLILFFTRDSTNYNLQSFHQTIPIISMSIFVILSLLYSRNLFIKLLELREKKEEI
jgi:hypothetical protein